MKISWWLALVNMFMMYADDPGTGGDGGGAGDGKGGEGGDDGKGGVGGNPAGGDGKAGDKGGDPNGKTPPADDQNKGGNPPSLQWPENWREDYAKGDDKMLTRLKRFNSPRDVIDSYIAADKKLTSGELKTAAPKKDAKPEELARWREENGIPADPKGYLETLDLGNLELGDADKEVVADFFLTAHEHNMHPSEVNAAVAWYFDLQEREGALEAQRISAAKLDAESELHKDWGDMYKPNLTAAVTLLDKGGDGLKDYVLSATGPDGLPLGNNPQFLRFLAQAAKDIDPAATVVPGAGTNSSRAIDDEIAALEKRMKEDRNNYFKDEKAQARYRELITAREKIKGN